jgi:hypothetical protein
MWASGLQISELSSQPEPHLFKKIPDKLFTDGHLTIVLGRLKYGQFRRNLSGPLGLESVAPDL